MSQAFRRSRRQAREEAARAQPAQVSQVVWTSHPRLRHCVVDGVCLLQQLWTDNTGREDWRTIDVVDGGPAGLALHE